MGNAASCAVFNEAPYPILVEQYAPKDSLAEFTVATFQLRPGEACEVPPLKKHKNVRIKVSAPEEGRCGELPQTLHAGQHLRIHRVKKVKTARDFIKDECSSASTSPSLNLEHASSCPDRVSLDYVHQPDKEHDLDWLDKRHRYDELGNVILLGHRDLRVPLEKVSSSFTTVVANARH